MRLPIAIALAAAALSAVGCTGSNSMPGSMTAPSASTPAAAATMSGTWTGSATDSTGTMMGAPMSPAMMAGMTWQITQTGNAFSGVMQVPGYSGAMMTIAGAVDGHTATFTMTMPGGGMMASSCSAVASGTLDLDDLFMHMHGAYSGSNNCTGPFDRGQMSMTRR